MKKQLLILMTLFIAKIGYSQTFTALDNNNNTLEYNITSANSVEVNDYISGGTDVDIPTTVDNTVSSVTITYTVTAIGNSAFLSNGLESVVIPDSVISIGIGAFNGNALTTAIIGNSVESIGNIAFFNNQLNSITIPSNVTSIGSSAFLNNPLTCIISEGSIPAAIITPAGGNTSTDSFSSSRNIIDLSIPSGTASAYATAQWTGFNSVAEGLTSFFIVDNITYTVTSTINNTVRTSNYNVAGGTVVNIPATVSRGCETYDVTEVGSFFQKNLTSVTIPNSVTVISSSAFLNNPNLVSAPLHNGITSIGTNAFNNCNLTSVNIPTSMTIIEDATFGGNNIASITIPDNITSLGNSAFQNNNITNVVLSNSLTSIGNFAFENNNISSVSFPNTLTNIGQGAFMNNDLTTLSIPNGITDIPENAFLQNNITSVIIPDSVISIGNTAFRTNQLTTVTIPSSVTNIGDRAFDNNPLTDVTSLATTPPAIITGSNDSFSTNRGAIHLHIPTGTTGIYVTNPAPGADWTGFNPVTEDASLSTSNFELAHDIRIISSFDKVEVMHSKSIELQHYNIYSISGVKIKEGKENSINVNTLSNGIYILELKFNEGRVAKKFVK